jgi:hypothetical protein
MYLTKIIHSFGESPQGRPPERFLFLQLAAHDAQCASSDALHTLKTIFHADKKIYVNNVLKNINNPISFSGFGDKRASDDE